MLTINTHKSVVRLSTFETFHAPIQLPRNMSNNIYQTHDEVPREDPQPLASDDAQPRADGHRPGQRARAAGTDRDIRL